MVKIVADTTSCMTLQEAQEKGIYYIPQIIVIGEETYRDDTEMNPIEFLERQRTSSVLPKTAAPPPILYNPIYKELSEQGHTILVICPSAQLSGTVRSATVAANDFPNADIRIIDTETICGGLASIVLQAKKWADEGMDVDTIIERVKDLGKRSRTYFVVDTLEFLYKGGRIGAAAALVGSMLQMKPILHLKDGHTEPFEKQLTHRRAIARLKEVVKSECPHGEEGMLSIMHGNAEAEARIIAKELGVMLDIPEESIPIYDLTPAILVHSGPGVIVTAFTAKV